MRPDVNLWARWLEHLDQVVLTRRQEVTGEEHGGLIVGGIVEVEDLRVRGLMEWICSGRPAICSRIAPARTHPITGQG